jgi:hypothetical protein
MIPATISAQTIPLVASEGMFSAQKQKTHHPDLGWRVRIIASVKRCRRDYPRHPAFGQAQQANFQRQFAQPSAEWLTTRMLVRLPEGQKRRKPKLQSSEARHFLRSPARFPGGSGGSGD